MGEAEVEEEYLDQRPVLFVVVALDEVDFKFLHLF